MLRQMYYILFISLCLSNVYAQEHTNTTNSSNAFTNFFGELGQDLKNPATIHLIKQAFAAGFYTCAGSLAAYLAYQNTQTLKKTDVLPTRELLASNVLFLTAASGFCVYKSYTSYAQIFTSDALIQTMAIASVEKNGNIATTASFAIEL